MFTVPAVLADLTFVGVAGFAAWSDLSARRIPNPLTVAGLAAALLLRAPAGADALLTGLQGAGLGLAVGFLLFAIGAVAAGDAKLLAVIGAFMGPGGLIGAFALGAVLGAVLAVVDAARRGVLPLLLLKLRDAARLRHERSPLAIPYGVPLALGAVIWWFYGATLTEVLFV